VERVAMAKAVGVVVRVTEERAKAMGAEAEDCLRS
jgi:hypothetical protein